MHSFYRFERFLLAAILVTVVLAIYHPVVGFDFVNYDDDLVVTKNRLVQGGLTAGGLAGAFAPGESANWVPLTRISLMLDMKLFGGRPAGFHFTNLLLHAFSTVLLFLALAAMTGALLRSFLAAAVFAVHPLNVESVAWIAERRDVLSALFWMLTLLAYHRYALSPSRRRYLAVFAVLALGLMAKAMLVTLPFVLLLLDWWPLKRLEAKGRGGEPGVFPTRPLRSLVLEKVPLLTLAAFFSILTFILQKSSGAVQSTEKYSLPVRAANTVLSYVLYISKAIWPSSLAVYYPHPGESVSYFAAAAAALLLAAITALALRQRWRRPWLAVGWLWYLGTLVPVIGLVQAGTQARADRFTYIPLIGLSIVAVWGAAEFLRGRRAAAALFAAASLTALATAARVQVSHWRDSETLFTHALEVGAESALAHNNLGNSLSDQGRYIEAVAHYNEALRIKSGSWMVHNNLATSLKHLGRDEESARHLRKALRLNPEKADVLFNLGNYHARRKEFAEALALYDRALRSRPHHALAHRNMAKVLFRQERYEEAAEHYLKALRENPGDAVLHHDIGNAFFQQERHQEAAEHYREALLLDPERAITHNNLASALLASGEEDEALEHYREALRLDPDHDEASHNIGRVLSRRGRNEEAASAFRRALEADPGRADSHRALGDVLFRLGRLAGAEEAYRAVLGVEPENAAAHNNLGTVLFRGGKLDEGAEHYREALRLDPDYSLAAYNLGNYLLRSGRFGEAVAMYEEALRVNPGDEKSRENMRRALQLLGRERDKD